MTKEQAVGYVKQFVVNVTTEEASRIANYMVEHNASVLHACGQLYGNGICHCTPCCRARGMFR